MRGDGQPTNQPVAETTQQRAFDALLQTLQPDFLALPESIIRLIPPQPIGFDRDREMFKSNTGGFFDPLSAAASSASLSLDMLLQPERLNRLSEQQARGTLRSFTLSNMLHQLRGKLFATQTDALPMQAEIRRLIQQLYLNRLFSVAVSETTTATVKGNILLEINTIEKESSQRIASTTNVAEQANLIYLLHQIRLFREKPETFKPLPSPGLPPGQPIGCGEE